jgi:hypothetical protein
MTFLARDIAAFGSLVVFAATVAVWGEVLLALN